ncbi:hypothetical protein [Aquabacterium humicola]|uniref:hypothetical protein n=1 Tax=Aquabacterium humicola TaxID=3237377 RepID=UPI0025426C2D|nr:hypothetical protein [Rubrivivax pictus]
MGALQVNANNGYELRFESLFVAGRGFSFPCNAQGAVDLNQLSDRARCNYLFARALVGREFAAPTVALDIVQ